MIKRKIDVMQFLEDFHEVASFDHEKQKFYFVFADKERDGQYTLMKKDNNWTTHGRGADYCEDGETSFADIDELVDFLWKHRAKINQALKEQQKETVVL